MQFGFLADYFDGVGAKILSEVEVKRQHEFQGVEGFRAFLGTPAEKRKYPASFYWLNDEVGPVPAGLGSFCTWSDVRRDQPRRGPEYHLYYSADSEPVVHRARAGDQLVIALRRDGTLMVLLSSASSTISRQLLWLFGLDLLDDQVSSRSLTRENTPELGHAARSVLEAIGVEVESPEPAAFDALVDRWGRAFPGTVELSAFARKTLPEADPLTDPDDALVAWMEHEEALFRSLEHGVISDQLEVGFHRDGKADVDAFLSFSLSVQNRRKSRAGLAFGHHVEAILLAHQVSFTREATTEKRNAADFLFPGEDDYADPLYAADRLVMLAVKTSCKDRWRQVLAEADRIPRKHLLTLEPAISRGQTAEMHGQSLQLVLPQSLHDTYQPDQRALLMDVSGFLELVGELPGAAAIAVLSRSVPAAVSDQIGLRLAGLARSLCG